MTPSQAKIHAALMAMTPEDRAEALYAEARFQANKRNARYQATRIANRERSRHDRIMRSVERVKQGLALLLPEVDRGV